MNLAANSGQWSAAAAAAGAAAAGFGAGADELPLPQAESTTHQTATAHGTRMRSTPDFSVQTPHLEREQRSNSVALDLELDRTAAHFAVFYVRRLLGSQVDACLQPLAAMRAAHGDEFFRQRARRSLSRLPHGLESVELV